MMRPFIAAALTLSLMLAGYAVPARALGPLPPGATLWDGFNPPEKKLDPVSWFLGDQPTGNGALGLELRREITGGKLVLSHRAVGTTNTAFVRGFSNNRLFLNPPHAITFFQADLKIASFGTTNCDTTPEGQSVIAFQQLNRLFNTVALNGNGGTFAGDGGACTASPATSCDVYAMFLVEHSLLFNGPDVFDIRARVFAQPIDANGNPTGFQIPIGDTNIGPLTGSLKKNQNVTLRWTWNQSDRVTFETSQKGTMPVDIVYGTVGTVNPLTFLFNDVEAVVFPCNSSTATPGSGDLGATVDKIFIIAP